MNTSSSNVSSSAIDLELVKISTVRLPLAAFCLTFFTLLPLAFLSVDLTDPGYHLVQQILANKMGWSYFHLDPSLFLTNIIGGWWLQLTDPLGLIGVKLGGTLVYSTCSAMVCVTFQNFIKNKKLLLFSVYVAMLVATFALFRMSLMLHLNYYTVSMLFEVIFMTISFNFIRKPTLTGSVALGVLLPLMILVRVTLIVFCIAPLICFFFLPRNKRYLSLIQILAGLAFVLLTGVTYKINFFSGVLALKDSLHNIALYSGLDNTLVANLSQIYSIIKVYAVSAILLSPLILIRDASKRKRWLWNISLVLFTFFIFTPFLPTTQSFIPIKLKTGSALNGMLTWVQNFVPKGFAISTLILGSVLYVLNYYKNALKTSDSLNQKSKELLFIFLLSLVCILAVLGSLCGLDKACFGCWYLFMVLTALVSKKQEHVRIWSKSAVIVAFSCLSFLYTHFNADDLWSLPRWTFCRNGRLKGTIVNQRKRPYLDELTTTLARFANPKDSAIFYHFAPTFYYLTNTVPVVYLAEPLDMNLAYLEKTLDESFKSRTPKIIVKAKFNSWNYLWHKEIPCDNRKDGYFIKRFEKQVHLLERKMKEYYQPKKVWESDAFEFYVPTLNNPESD